jgi:site-specific recombinase XerC
LNYSSLLAVTAYLQERLARVIVFILNALPKLSALTSPGKSGLSLKLQDNPMLAVEAPKVEKKILPSLTLEQLEHVIDSAKCVRDKAIISLFADSGPRLSELEKLEPRNIDWEHRPIKVRCKGNKEGYAPFGERTDKLLKEWLTQYKPTR